MKILGTNLHDLDPLQILSLLGLATCALFLVLLAPKVARMLAA